MPRVIVLGAGGFFGSVATDCLQAEGFTPVRSSRRPGVFELQVDANDAESIRSSLRPGDIVLDAAGPFQSRTTALVTAVSAALVRLSGVAQPARVSVFLAPASRATANPATIRSFLASVGKPVTVRRDARLVPQAGWRVSRPFAWPGR